MIERIETESMKKILKEKEIYDDLTEQEIEVKGEVIVKIEKIEIKINQKIIVTEEMIINNIVGTTKKGTSFIIEKIITVEMLGTAITKKIRVIDYIICMGDTIMILMLTTINISNILSNCVKLTLNLMQNGIDNIIAKCKEML